MKIKRLFCLLIFAATFGLNGCKPKDASIASSASNTLDATNTLAVPAQANPAFEKLKGRWERPDGGYILELRSVEAGGKVEAGYFNPSPIHVAGARIYSEGGETKVFVELRDVNYPGCTYKLIHDAKTDQLFGQYYQALQQHIYDVTFVRQK